MAIRVEGESSPKLSQSYGDDSLEAIIDASIEDVSKTVYLDEINVIDSDQKAALDSDIEIVSDYVDYELSETGEVSADEISWEHTQQELPSPDPASVQSFEKLSRKKYPADVRLAELGRVAWGEKLVPLNDPQLYEDVRRYVENYSSDNPEKATLRRMISGTKSLTDFSKEFLNVLVNQFGRQGIDADYLALKSGQVLPGVDPFHPKKGIYNAANMPDIAKCENVKEYNRQCEALRMSAEYPGIFRKAVGLFVLDAAKRIVLFIGEKQELNVNDISYGQLMPAVYRAAESAIAIAKREIAAELAIVRKREISHTVRTTKDVKVAIQQARDAGDPNEARNIDLFGRKFRLRRGESSTQAAARARREYREGVSERINTLEKQGLLPVLAAAVAQGRGAGAVTAVDITRAQSLIKTAKTSYGAFQSPKALIEQALGGADAVSAIKQQAGRDPVRSLLASLKADTRRNELLSGLQTFGRTLSRLQDKSASIKASNKAQAAQFAADALLKSGFEPPNVLAIRAAMRGQGWTLEDARQQNVRLRGLDKGIVNALGEPASKLKQSARDITKAVRASNVISQVVDAEGQKTTLGEALKRHLRRLQAQQSRQDNDPDDGNSPKR